MWGSESGFKPQGNGETMEVSDQVINNEGASLVAQVVKNPPAMQESQVQSLVGKIPWRREPNLWASQVAYVVKNLPDNAGDMGWSLTGYSPWGQKESDTTECIHTYTPTHPTQRTDCRRGNEGPGLGSIEEEDL